MFYMVKYKWDNFIFSKIRFKNDDAVVLEILENYCAETLKHVKNLYDQTKYLKGVINMVSNFYWLITRAKLDTKIINGNQ